MSGGPRGQQCRTHQQGPTHGGGRTYQLLDALIDQELREGGLHRLHCEAQSAIREPLQPLQPGAEVVVGLTRDIQVSEREVQPANKQPTHMPHLPAAP